MSVMCVCLYVSLCVCLCVSLFVCVFDSVCSRVCVLMNPLIECVLKISYLEDIVHKYCGVHLIPVVCIVDEGKLDDKIIGKSDHS